MELTLDHIQVAIPRGGEEKARAFYGTLLGLQEVQKPSALIQRGGCWFELADLQLHLGVDTDFVPARKAHPAFRVLDLQGLAQCLQASGYEVTPDVKIPDVMRFYTSDPFGNRLEFMQIHQGGP